MRKQRSIAANAWDQSTTERTRDFDEARPEARVAYANSPEEIFGEIGLVLVVVLGIILAINMVLIGLHLS